MIYKLYSFVLRSKYRTKTVFALDVERTPSQISKIIKINISHLSRALRELVNNRIVECVTKKKRYRKDI